MKRLVQIASLLLLNAAAIAADSDHVSVTVKTGGTDCLLRGKSMNCSALAAPLEDALKSSQANSVVLGHEGCGEVAMAEAMSVAENLKRSGFQNVSVVGFLYEPGMSCGTPVAQFDKLVDAPEGYEWYVFEEGNTACLRPREWFVRTEVKGDTAAMFFSKEDIDKEGEFETGLTLNVVSRIQARTGRPPSQYARDYLDEFLEKYPDAQRFEEPPQYGMKVISAALINDVSPVFMITKLLADDQADVLRIFILEFSRGAWYENYAMTNRFFDCKIRR